MTPSRSWCLLQHSARAAQGDPAWPGAWQLQPAGQIHDSAHKGWRETGQVVGCGHAPPDVGSSGCTWAWRNLASLGVPFRSWAGDAEAERSLHCLSGGTSHLVAKEVCSDGSGEVLVQ